MYETTSAVGPLTKSPLTKKRLNCLITSIYRTLKRISKVFPLKYEGISSLAYFIADLSADMLIH